MQRITFFLLLIICCCSCAKTKEKVKAPITKIGEWQPLFNGENLDGWEKMGTYETLIKNEELHLHASHPYQNFWLKNKMYYRNFNLELEFLMADSVANSGTLFRFDDRREGMPNQTAYEANIDWRTNLQAVMGSIENAARATSIANLNINDWQKMRITANYDLLQIYLNDQLICETTNRRADAGQIALQPPVYQGDDIAFRNIRIQELPDTATLAPTLEDTYRNSDRPLQKLFVDGQMGNWQAVGTGVWTFEEGALHGYSGEETSYLVSNNVYKNFYLKYKFKIKKEDNSGVFIRRHPDSTNVSLADAIECNIYDHNGYEHAYSTGSIVTHARAFANLIKYEEWNEMEIFARDEQVILTINGMKSAEKFMATPFNKAGQICLQVGTKVFTDNSPSDIYFKDLELRIMD